MASEGRTEATVLLLAAVAVGALVSGQSLHSNFSRSHINLNWGLLCHGGQLVHLPETLPAIGTHSDTAAKMQLRLTLVA
jgi:hypothetical protein